MISVGIMVITVPEIMVLKGGGVIGRMGLVEGQLYKGFYARKRSDWIERQAVQVG